LQRDSVHGCWPLTTWTLCTRHGCRPARAFQRRKSIRENETSRDLRVPLRPPARRPPYLLLLCRRHLSQVSYGFFYVTRVPLDRLLHPGHGSSRGKVFHPLANLYSDRSLRLPTSGRLGHFQWGEEILGTGVPAPERSTRNNAHHPVPIKPVRATGGQAFIGTKLPDRRPKLLLRMMEGGVEIASPRVGGWGHHSQLCVHLPNLQTYESRDRGLWLRMQAVALPTISNQF